MSEFRKIYAGYDVTSCEAVYYEQAGWHIYLKMWKKKPAKKTAAGNRRKRKGKAGSRAQTAAGKTIYLEAGDGVKVTTEAPEEDWDGCRFKEMEIALDEVPEILRQLGIVPQNVEEETAYIYADSGEKEAVPFRGSGFGDTSYGGLGALHLYHHRSNVYNDVGFRSAYVEFEELETEN